MSFEQDPPRLRTLGDELPGNLSQALEASPGETASPEELARVAAGVRIAAAAASSSSRKGAGFGLFSRQPKFVGRAAALAALLVVGAGAGAVVSGALFLLRGTSSDANERPASGVLENPPAVESPPAPAPAQSSSLLAGDVAVPPVPRTPSSASERLTPKPSAFVDRGVTEPQDAGVREDELALLARAQSSLAGDPKTALELTAIHERTYQGGVLAQEREVIAIDALLRLGRSTEATSRAQRFHRNFPASAHGRRVEVLFGVHQVPAQDHN